MAKRQNIFLVGPMGAGKSTIGRLIAQSLSWVFYDTDQEIEKRCGADIAWIFDIEGEAGFRHREIKIIDELTQLSPIVLSTGGGAVVAPENRLALSSRGIVIYLKTSLETQYDRTRYDAKRPLLQTENVQGRLIELCEQRSPLYEEISDFSFDTDGHSVKYIANYIVQHLQDLRLL